MASTPARAAWTFSRVARYGAATATGVWLGVKLHEAGGNLHRFEYLVLRSLKRLHFYPPPATVADGGLDAQLRLTTAGMPVEVVERFSEWFLAEDAKRKHGLLRQDVVDFVQEQAGLAVEEAPLKEFLNKGRGRGEEQQRLSEVSLLGGLVFLRAVLKTNSLENIDKTKRKLSGAEELDSIQLAVLDKEKHVLLLKEENLSDAERQRLDELRRLTARI